MVFPSSREEKRKDEKYGQFQYDNRREKGSVKCVTRVWEGEEKENPAKAGSECLKRKCPIKDSHLQVRNLKLQFVRDPKMEKPHESETVGHAEQRRQIFWKHNLPGARRVGCLLSASKPSLPGLVYADTYFCFWKITAQISGREIQ